MSDTRIIAESPDRSVEHENIIGNFFIRMNKILMCCGLPIIWLENWELPKTVVKLWYAYKLITNIMIVMFVAMEWGAFITQNDLTDNQKSDRLIFNVTHPFLLVYIASIEYNKEKIKLVLYELMVTLKKVHNDVELDKKIVRKSTFYTVSFFSAVFLTIFFYGLNAWSHFKKTGAFIKTITFWPDVNEICVAADIVRIINYIFLGILLTRVSGVYMMVIMFTICMSHQYTNLNAYFLSLNKIFSEDLSQIEKEIKYEKAFKIGIKLHSHTMWCKKQCQSMFNVFFSFQVVLNVTLLVLLMSQLMSTERTLINVFPVVSTGVALLCSTGFFMWNAGDVTVEASQLGTAVYCSGWQNCHQRTLRIRHLLLMTLRQGQKPEVLRALGIVALSYETYLSIVKASYSIFSVTL